MEEKRLQKIPSPQDILEKLKVKLPPEKVIDAGVLHTILLDEVAGRLEELTDVMVQIREKMQRVPQGVQCTIEKTITGNIPTVVDLVKEPDADYKIWYSATITNDEDSENDVYAVVNLPTRKYRRLRPSESLSVDFHAPLLKKIYLKCNAADETANVIIIGEY